MSISRFVPPLDYLKAASPASLQSYELARLNHAANLRREIAALIDQWIQESSEATLARWILDHRESLHDEPAPVPGALSMFPDPETAPLCDSPTPMTEIVRAPPRFSGPQSQINPATGRKPQKQRASGGH